MGNPFVHLELTTPDLAKAKEFYSGMFGWSFEDMPMGPDSIYSVFRPSEGPGGGFMTMPGVPTGWLAYVGVEDARKATDQARSLGAQVIRDCQEVPGMGWFSILIDPTGASIAIWQTAAKQG